MRNREVDELAARSTGGRVLATLAIAVLVLVAIDVASIWFLARRSTNLGNRLVHRKWELLLEQEPPVDWLFLGDSSCNQGVRPAVFDRLMGVRSLNLCTTAQVLVINDAWMLQAHVERHGPPRGVALVHVYDIWPRREDGRDGRDSIFSSLAHVPLEWGFWRELRPELELSNEQLRTLFLSRYVPLYSQNRTLQAWLRHPIEQQTLAGDLGLDAQGFMARGARAGGPSRDLRRHLRKLDRAKARISSINRRALTEIARLAERHRFPVYLVNSPIYEGLLRHAKFREREADLQRQLRAVDEESPALHYIPDWIAFPQEQMESTDHVGAEAARVYTEKLAEAIRAAQVPLP